MLFTFVNPLAMDIIPKISLVRYKWQQAGGVLATGYIRHEDTFVTSRQLADSLDSKANYFADFKEIASQMNGQFSLIAEKNGKVWISCCQTWSYPLFYHFSSAGLWISDDPREILARMGKPALKKEILPYFLNFGVTPGSETLVEEIQQARPGEVICFSLKSKEKEHFLPDRGMDKISLQSDDETYAQLHKVFVKYSGFLNGKKVLVPLTGGYDSRLIACMLKEAGHNNVLCATWGRSGNSETGTAEKVAKTLGFPWVFVPTDEQVKPGFWNEALFMRYIDWSGHFSSMPYLQDYFAIHFLIESGLIDEDTVALPGHPGDFLRGSHLYSDLPEQNKGEVIDSIIDNFGTSLPLTKTERTIVRDIIAAGYCSDDRLFNPVAAYERWDMEERQCKFIGNSSQVYSFFGISQVVPLFDKELLDYFLALPFEQRLGASKYNKTIENMVFKPLGCDFNLKPVGVTMKTGNKWKSFLLKMLPLPLKEWYYPVKDDAFYRELTEALMESDFSNRYRKPFKSHYYNCYLTQWYKYFVENQLHHTFLEKSK